MTTHLPTSSGGEPAQTTETCPPAADLPLAELQRAIAHATARYESDLQKLNAGSDTLLERTSIATGADPAPASRSTPRPSHAPVAAEPGTPPAASDQGIRPFPLAGSTVPPRSPGGRAARWIAAVGLALLLMTTLLTLAARRLAGNQAEPRPMAIATAAFSTAPAASATVPAAVPPAATVIPTPLPAEAHASAPVPVPVGTAPSPVATATLPASPMLASEVSAAEAGLRSGTFQIAIDYGHGNHSEVMVRFDLGGPAGPRRMAFTSTSRGRSDQQPVEVIAVDERTWQRLPDGGWAPAVSQDGLWEQLHEYLPRIQDAANPTVTRSGDVLSLRWTADDRDADLELRVDPGTGQPLQLRVSNRASQTTMVVTYSGWNVPVSIVEPGT